MSMSLREKLKDHIVSKLDEEGKLKVGSKWNNKAINHSGKEIDEFAPSLEGQILTEIDYDEQGRIKGWYTFDVEDMEAHLERRDNPSLRINKIIGPKEGHTPGKFQGRNLRSLNAAEHEEHTGHKPFMDRWRAEGIDI